MIDMLPLHFHASAPCTDKSKENNTTGRNINHNKANKFWHIRYM